MPYLWILHACVCVLKGRDAGIPEQFTELSLRAPSCWTTCIECALLRSKHCYQQTLESKPRHETC